MVAQLQVQQFATFGLLLMGIGEVEPVGTIQVSAGKPAGVALVSQAQVVGVAWGVGLFAAIEVVIKGDVIGETGGYGWDRTNL